MVIVILAALARAQDYAFPSSVDDHAEYYPTAYFDHGGTTDWDCGALTYGGHQGSDFGAGSFYGMDAGRDVNAAAGGTVTYTHDGEFDRCTSGACYGGGGFGNWVKLLHPDGKETIYGHLKQWSVQVAVGDWVDCGAKLGEMGSSGYSTGPHLHFQVENNGYPADPFDGPCSFPPTWWVVQGAYADLPDLACDSAEPCASVATLTCGDVVTAANDAAGSTSSHWVYGCTDFTYSGPELAYTVETGLDEPVTIEVTGLSADVDVFVADSDTCDGQGCLAASTNPDASDEALVFDAVADVPYTVVVDGWEGAVTGFTLTVTCAGAPGEPTDPTDPTGSEPTDTAPVGTEPTGGPEPVDTDVPPLADDTGPASQPEVISEGKLGCACDTSPSASPWAALGVLALVRRRRR